MSAHGWALKKKSKTSGMMPIVLPIKELCETGRFAIMHRMWTENGRRVGKGRKVERQKAM